MTNLELLEKAKQTRKEVFKFKTSSGFGHLASCLSCVDIVTSIYYDKNIEFDPKQIVSGWANAVSMIGIGLTFTVTVNG